jgi:hypothetical protein
MEPPKHLEALGKKSKFFTVFDRVNWYMKSREWLILGLLFLFLNNFLIFEDFKWQSSCDLNMKFSTPVETVGDMICVINSEILDPFIWTTGGIAVICWIMAIVVWLEERQIKKKEETASLNMVRMQLHKLREKKIKENWDNVNKRHS